MNLRSSGESLLALLLGGAIGAGLGLLFAERTGKSTRRRIKVFVDGVGEKTGELIEDGRDSVEDIVHATKKSFKR
jgi:gas vesicle protein